MNINSTYSSFTNPLWRLLLGSLMAIGFLLAGHTAYAQLPGNGTCMGDIYGAAGAPGGLPLNCSAKEVYIAEDAGGEPLVSVNVLDPCDGTPNDTATVEIEATLHFNADRYDVGVYTAADGGDALTGACFQDILPYTSPFSDLDDFPATGDSCGDADVSEIGTEVPGFEFQTLTLECVDNDADGFLDLNTCFSWRVSGNNDFCGGIEDVYPGNKSKCFCSSGNIPVPVPSTIEVVKNLNPTDDTGLFDLEIDASVEKADATHLGTTGPILINDGIHSISESGGTGTNLNNYDSAIACIDQVGRCAGDASVRCDSDSACSEVSGNNKTCDLTPTTVASCTDCTSVDVTTSAGLREEIICTITNTLDFIPEPAIDLVKSFASNDDADNSNDISAGDTLTYNFDVTNIGNVNLSSVEVNDPVTGLVTCPQDTLATDPDFTTPFDGESITCTATYLVTPEDVAAGFVFNLATAFGTDNNGTEVQDTDEVTVLLESPSLATEKMFDGISIDADGSGDVSAGDTLAYTITVTNTGEVDLTNVTVDDDLTGTVDAPCAALLLPTESCSVNTTYVVTPDDVTSTVINNIGSGDSDQTDPNTDEEDVPVPTPSHTTAKALSGNADEDGSGDVSAGDTLTYTITVTNTGSANLTNVTVDDDLTGTVDALCAATLAPNANCSVDVQYVVKATDLGTTITNIGSGDTDQTDPNTDEEDVPVPTPSHTTAKALSGNADEDGSGDVSAGDTLTYTITVTNTGSANLTNVTVDDDLTGTVDALCAATLAPNADCSVDVQYVVKATDLGTTITNIGSGDTDQTDPNTDEEDVPVPTPAHTTAKALSGNADEDGSGDVSAGDTLTYTITVTNTGTANLTNVTVDDDLTGTVDALCAATLAPNADCSVDVQYVVKATDLGTTINNIGSGDTDQTDPNTDEEDVPVPTPSHTTAKALSGNADEDGSGDVSAGDTLTYTITVTNTGTANLTNVTVDDDLTGTVDALCAATLAPNANCSVDVQYVVKATDLGTTITNIGSGDTDQTDPNTDEEDVPVPTPAHTTAKALSGNADEDGSGDVSAGDTLTYTITVTNTGTANLTNVTVDDDLTGTVDALCAATLAPNADCSVDVQYVVKATDLGTTINNIGSGDTDQTDPNTDEEDVPVPTPSHTTAKALSGNADEDGSGDVSAGDTLTYTITVTNTGTANLTNVTVDDDLTGTVDALCAATLAPNADCSVDVQYVVKATDLGTTINNIGSGDTDQTDPNTDEEDVPVPTPSHTTAKALSGNADEDGSGDVSAGDTLTYTITVTNTGTANLTNVTVDDNLTGTVGAPCAATLAPNADCSVDVTYVVKATDLGTTITNIGSGDTDQTEPNTDDETVPVPTPSHTTAKALSGNADEDGSGDVSAGDTLTYTITVTNTGTANLTNVTVDDNLTGTVGAPCAATLAPNADCSVDVTYVVKATDLGTTITNIGSGDTDQTEPNTDDETVPVPTPSHTTAKALSGNADEDGSGDVSAGDTLTYTITVTNTGTANLTNVTVDDDLTGTVGAPCAATLAPNADCSVDVTYVVKATDLGTTITNIGSGDTDQTEPNTDDETVPVPTPSHTTAKALSGNADEDGSGDVSAGDTLTYTITVTNTGTANLTNVTVDDNLTGTVGAPCAATLAPNADCSVDVQYVVKATDLGTTITNIGSGDTDQTEPNTDDEIVPVPTPAHTTAKALSGNADEDGSGDVSAGDTLTYTITVTNTGTANLTNVTVSDSLISPSTTTCALVAPTETCVLSGTYQVTAADVTAGIINNTGTGDSDQTPPSDDPEDVTVPSPSHTTDKALTNNADEDSSGDVSAGDTLTYTITVTNTGTANLTNVTVSDSLISPSTTMCALVAPTETCVLSGTYQVSAADVTAGMINNTGTGDSDQTPPSDDPEDVEVPSPSHTTDKVLLSNTDEDGSQDVSAGDTLTYRITVTNNGTANLTNVTVDDDLTGTIDALCSALLAPNASCFVDVTYVVTPADVLAGVINNIGTGDTDQTDPNSDPETVSVPSPSLSTVKALTNNADEDGSLDVSAGDTLTYTITVTNTGTANLTNVTVSDSLISPSTTMCALVAPTETCVLSGTYQVTAADVTAGMINNTGTGDSDQTPPSDDPEDVEVPSPSHTTDKVLLSNTDEDGSQDVSAGDTLTYTITVTNTGTANLTNVTVSDSLISPSTTMCALVAPTETCVLSGTYQVTAADVTAGMINNTGTGDSDQTPPSDDPEDVEVPSPSHTTDKVLLSNTDEDGSQDVSAGDTLTYRITVTNNGTANLTNVTVDDDLTGTIDALCSALLAPNASCFVDVTYVVTPADVLAGVINNIGTGDTDQTDPNSDPETVSVPSPSLSTVKALTNNADEDGSLDVSAGDTLTYTITVTNTGTANLTNVTVSDSLISPSTTMCALVAPTETCVLSGTYQVTAADVTAGMINNTGTGDSDQTPPSDDPEDVTVPSSTLVLDKRFVDYTDADGSQDISAGDTLNYAFDVTAEGSANLTDVSVNDPLTGGAVNCPSGNPIPLLPAGTTETCTSSYLVQSGDLGGDIVNTATADSDQTGPVTDTETISVPSPSLSTEKVLTNNADEDGSLDVSVGDTLTYRITVTNTGSANLTNVTIDDDLTGTTDAPCSALLAPSATCFVDVTYVVTPADVLAGVITNIGTGDSVQTPPSEDMEEVSVPFPSLVVDKQAVLITNSDSTDGGSSVDEAGDKITYDITVTNNGTANLTNVTVDDDLTSTVGAPCAAFLAPDESCTVTVMYTVTQSDLDQNGANPTSNGFIDNTGSGDSFQTDPVTDSVQVPVVQTPSVDIVKTFVDDSVTAGGSGSSLTLEVTNDGNITLNNVVVSDTVNSDLVITGVDCAGGTDTTLGQDVSCTFGTLNVGDTRTITVYFEVDASVPEALAVNNIANVNGSTDTAGPVDDNDSDTIDILTEIDLSIVKTFYRIDDNGTPNNEGDDFRVEDGKVEQGTTGFFEIVVDNAITAPSDAVGVVISDIVHPSLAVTSVITSGDVDCTDMDSNLQTIDCVADIPAGTSVTVTVQYQAAEFLNPDDPSSTTEGDDFRFVFLNGYILEGSSDTNGEAFIMVTAPDGTVSEWEYDGTKNEVNFDPSLILDADGFQVFPDGNLFTMHLSCSDLFVDGWGQAGGPLEGADDEWRISSWSVLRYNQNGFFKGCGDVVVPLDVDNTAFADGTDSNSELGTDEQVEDTATVQIIRQLKIENRSEPVIKGKKLDVLLSNTGEDQLTITQVELEWTSNNGNLVSVQFGANNTIWSGSKGSPATILQSELGGDLTIDPGEALKLAYFFRGKAKSGTYKITVSFASLLTTEVVTLTRTL